MMIMETGAAKDAERDVLDGASAGECDRRPVNAAR